jgi:hypothetical protein
VDSPVTDASRELSTLSGAGGAFFNAQRLLAPFIEERQGLALLDELLIEQLLGLLNWMSEVLVGGRFHLAQIISARRAAAMRGYCTCGGCASGHQKR